MRLLHATKTVQLTSENFTGTRIEKGTRVIANNANETLKKNGKPSEKRSGFTCCLKSLECYASPASPSLPLIVELSSSEKNKRNRMLYSALKRISTSSSKSDTLDN